MSDQAPDKNQTNTWKERILSDFTSIDGPLVSRKTLSRPFCCPDFLDPVVLSSHSEFERPSIMSDSDSEQPEAQQANDAPPKPYTRCYFSDSDIILQVSTIGNRGIKQTVLLHVHKTGLAHHSPVFANMFSLPMDPPVNAVYDSVPLCAYTRRCTFSYSRYCCDLQSRAMSHIICDTQFLTVH